MSTRNGVTKECVECGTEFYVPKYRTDTAKFCSKHCQNHGQYPSIEKMCENCGKEFSVSNSRVNQKFCSQLCRMDTKVTVKLRRKQQRKSRIAKRGNNSSRFVRTLLMAVRPPKCAYCEYDKRDYNVDVHHIDGNPNNNDLNNLDYLCVMCHRDFHQGNLIYENGKYYDPSEVVQHV